MEAPYIPCALSRRSMKSPHHPSCKGTYIILDSLQNLPKYYHNYHINELPIFVKLTNNSHIVTKTY